MTNAVRTDIKRVLLANVKDAPYGLLGFRRRTDDDTELLYECDGISVAISRKHELFEVIGLNDDDFVELKKILSHDSTMRPDLETNLVRNVFRNEILNCRLCV